MKSWAGPFPAFLGQFQVVLHGHPHMPDIHQKGDVLYFNPGNADPRRFTKPISIGYLEITDGVPQATWEHLEE